MLGADGVLVGTRFWAAEEALVADGFQRAAVEAIGDATQRSSLPDVARGLDWPAPFTIRTLRNAWVRQWETVPGGQPQMRRALLMLRRWPRATRSVRLRLLERRWG